MRSAVNPPRPWGGAVEGGGWAGARAGAQVLPIYGEVARRAGGAGADFGQERGNRLRKLAWLLDRDGMARALDELEPAAFDAGGDDLRRLGRAVLVFVRGHDQGRRSDPFELRVQRCDVEGRHGLAGVGVSPRVRRRPP